MKKKQINSILINQTKRRNTFIAYTCAIVTVFFFAISLTAAYVKNNRAQYVSYDESGNIDYIVQYKDNDYFENNYLNSNRQYIASLIDNINADFNYKIAFDDNNVEYKYSYRVDANIVVKEKNTQNIYYEKTEALIHEKDMVSSAKEVSINENLIINYDKYNEKIKRFVNVYELETAESTLNINMYVNVVGSCEDYSSNKEERVISLTIPLTKDSIAIDFVDDIINSSNNVMKCNTSTVENTILLLAAIMLIVVGVGLTISAVRYQIKTRTAETIYEKELKKILNNYGSSIQTIGNDFEFDGYQLLKIENFFDLLEISDKLRQPILMKENPEKNCAYFVIPSLTKLLYVYRMKVSDIKKEINKKKKKHLEEQDI